MEADKNIYLEAAKIVAECKPSKLPYVLAILKEGGIDIEEIPKLPSVRDLKRGSGKDKELAEKRKSRGHVEWEETDDPTVLALRDAFNNGLNMTRFSEASKIYRTAIYKYLSGEQPVSEYTRERINRGLATLGFKTQLEE